MSRAYIYFDELPPQTEFTLNGNNYIKQSSRTAYLLDYGRWFYMAARDLCIVDSYSRLDSDYFMGGE